jgi:hypothetical protein
MRASVVTLVHWGMAIWGGLCCIAFETISGPMKPLVPLAVLLPQAVWLVYVTRSARNAGITIW